VKKISRIAIDDACDLCGPSAKGRLGILIKVRGLFLVICQRCIERAAGLLRGDVT